MYDPRLLPLSHLFYRAVHRVNLENIEMVKRWAKAGGLMLAGTLLCILALAGCTVEEIETYTQNDALVRGGKACDIFYEEVGFANDRIEATSDEHLSGEEVDQLSDIHKKTDPLCQKAPMTGFDLYTVEQNTELVRQIDGKDDLAGGLF